MRATPASLHTDVLAGLVVLVVVVVAATTFALVRRRSDGRLDREDVRTVTAADLGAPALGDQATLVHFSTSFCQPCRAARTILREVANTVHGVTHVQVDAEAQLDLVRRLDVRRTPTILILDGAGVITERATGQPRKADVIAALGEAADVL